MPGKKAGPEGFPLTTDSGTAGWRYSPTAQSTSGCPRASLSNEKMDQAVYRFIHSIDYLDKHVG